jgi:hypothetical protein
MRLSLSLTAAAAALAVTFAAGGAEAAPLTVIVAASGPAIAGTSAAIGDYDVMLAFDPTLVVQSVTFGTGLNLGDPSASLQFDDNSTPGTADVFELSLADFASLLANQPDAFPLFTVLFDTGALDPSAAFASLSLSSVLVGDAIGNPLPASLVSFSSPDLPAVPEPASVTLLARALGAIAARRLRRSI